MIIEDIAYILIFSIIGICIFLIVLFFIEKKLGKRIQKRENNRNLFYIRKIESIEDKDPEKELEMINQNARGFFQEAFSVGRFMEYSELSEVFEKKHKKDIVDFCNLMTEELYSGKEKTHEDNLKLIKLLNKIIKDNPILTEEEKNEILYKRKEEVIKENINKVSELKKKILPDVKDKDDILVNNINKKDGSDSDKITSNFFNPIKNISNKKENNEIQEIKKEVQEIKKHDQELINLFKRKMDLYKKKLDHKNTPIKKSKNNQKENKKINLMNNEDREIEALQKKFEIFQNKERELISKIEKERLNNINNIEGVKVSKTKLSPSLEKEKKQFEKEFMEDFYSNLKNKVNKS